MAIRLKTTIGWEEWCALPDLNLPAVKAKIDTGAKTSALHAYDIETFKENEQSFVRFKIHPLQGNRKITRSCVAPLVEKRTVISSNGEHEKRPVILTTIICGGKTIQTEVTLTSRHNMAFRMLLGRAALKKARFNVNPAKSFLLGRRDRVEDLYTTP